MALAGQTGADVDLVSIDSALKIIYSRQEVVDETFKNRPLHALLGKETDFGGKSYAVDVITSLTQGRSGKFANAQANKSAFEVDQFNIYRAYDFSLAAVDIWTLFAAQGDKFAMLDALTKTINAARGTLLRSAVLKEYRDGTGEIGRVASVTTGANGTFTLTNPLDALNFEKNQVLNWYSASNSSPASDTFYSGMTTQHTAGVNGTSTFGKVTKVDRVNFTITCDYVPDNVVTTNGGDHVVTDGDYAYNSDGSGQGGIAGFTAISGLAAWLPANGPTSTKFMGLDRTGDAQRLAGVISNQSGKAEDEALLNGSQEIYMFGGGMIDHYMISPKRFNNLVKYAQPQRRYVKADKNSKVGFSGVEIMGQGGPITVLADPNCPDAYGYGLQLNTWKLKTLKSMPTFLTWRNTSIIEPSANKLELRIGYSGNMYTNAPGYNGVVLF